MKKRQARIRRGLRTKHFINQSGRARLVVYKSAKYIYAQLVKREASGDIIIASASCIDKEIKPNLSGDKKAHARLVGTTIAKRANEKNVTSVAFDRSGYPYHGRVKALAEAAREGGLIF